MHAQIALEHTEYVTDEFDADTVLVTEHPSVKL